MILSSEEGGDVVKKIVWLKIKTYFFPLVITLGKNFPLLL